MTERATVIGVDPGTKRIGVAIADLETRFATPLEVVEATGKAAARIAELAKENNAMTIVVGKPVSLSGAEGRAVDKQKELLEKIRAATDIEVLEYDERLTTVMAESALRAAGTKAGARKEIRDAVAAQVMLQGFLDSTR